MNRLKLFLFVGIGIMIAGFILMEMILSIHPSAQRIFEQRRECIQYYSKVMSNDTIVFDICGAMNPYDDRNVKRFLNIS